MMTAKRRLDARTAERLEQFLRLRRAELTERVRALMDAASGTEERANADHSDRASATYRTEMHAAQLDRLAHQVAEMDSALGRLIRRDYGWCDDCGSFIGLARLEALPFARRCRPCQSRAETDRDRALYPTGQKSEA